jgi:hypothetical protein
MDTTVTDLVLEDSPVEDFLAELTGNSLFAQLTGAARGMLEGIPETNFRYLTIQRRNSFDSAESMQKFKDFQSIQNAEMKDRLAMIQFEQMMDNFDARLEGLVDQVDQTNKGYHKMFTRSLVQAGFRRIGGNFTKDIIVGSTVIDGILRETRNIRAYQYMSYLMPDLRTEAGLTDTPAIKDFTAIQIMLEQALNVIAGEEKVVFGEGQEVLEAGKWREVEEDETLEDNAITKGTGLFGDWLGYAPVYKSGEDIKMHRGMLANQETYGSGEMGRIYGLMQWYQMQEGEGIAEVSQVSRLLCSSSRRG